MVFSMKAIRNLTLQILAKGLKIQVPAYAEKLTE